LHRHDLIAMTKKRRQSRPMDLHALPGHHIRRLQQIAVAVFLQETEGHAITPVQYAALQTVADQPGIDQRTLAGEIAFDTSTIASVIDRLEARGLLARSTSAEDKRVRLLTLTAEGDAVLAALAAGVQRAQQRMLAPLPKPQRAEFMRMLRTLVSANNAHSRAPREAAEAN
jgi:MarR family transcriptional regulator, lower aerobic nicotinate degradation pathway regulator